MFYALSLFLVYTTSVRWSLLADLFLAAVFPNKIPKNPNPIGSVSTGHQLDAELNNNVTTLQQTPSTIIRVSSAEAATGQRVSKVLI